MIKRKKAQVLLYGALAGILAAIIFSIVISVSDNKDFNIIGEYSLMLLKYSKKAESVLFYIDQSAKYSLQQAVYELAQNGGAVSELDIDRFDTSQPYTENVCGRFQGTYIWYKLKKDTLGNYFKTTCLDEKSLTINGVYYFDGNLNKYIENSPYDIPPNNYDYQVSSNLEIIGKAYSPIILNILKEEKVVVTHPSEFKSPETQENFIRFTGTDLCAKGRECLLTKEAYDLLKKAQEIANKYKVTLQVTYGYRTMEEQNRLWQKNPNSQLVCKPSPTCPHLSGKSVDVFLKDKTDWQLLYKIMAEAGWVLYAQKGDEHHFECCGTDRYSRAKAKGVTAII